MDSVKYIGMDVHKEAIAIAVLNSSSKLVMELGIATALVTIRPTWMRISPQARFSLS